MSLKGILTPMGPVGNPAAAARPCSCGNPPGNKTENDGFGPEFRKKLKTAAVPMGPSGAPPQFGSAKPVASTPGAATIMLPPPGVFMAKPPGGMRPAGHVVGGPDGAEGTMMPCGLLPDVTRPERTAISAFEIITSTRGGLMLRGRF